MFKHSKLALATLVAIGSTAALAQQAPAPAPAPQQLERVEVTGSNIKRTSKEGSSPIERITAQEIRESGAKTVLELMKLVPAVGADGFNDTPTQNGFSRGVATASLRSLSSTSTLILFNGRRMTPSAYANPNNGTSTLYDLNSIPISAIERVEIFKDGASAVYGSDAVGGVINFITKSDYQGAQIAARYGANDDGEFMRRSVNGTVGFGNLAKDGFNLLLSADLTQRGATSMRDGSNDIQAADYAAINLRLNPFSSSFNTLGTFTKESAPNSLAFPQNTAASRVVFNTAGCDPKQLLVGAPNLGVTGRPLLGTTFCNFDLDAYTDVQSKGEDLALISRGTIALGGDITAFAEAGYSKSDRFFRGAPRAFSGLSPTNNFLLGGLAPPFQAVLAVDHPDNPFRIGVDPVPGRAAVGLRIVVPRDGDTDLTNEQYRALIGARGTVLGNWDWEVAGLWNRTDRTETSYGFLQLPVLRQMLAPTNRTLASIVADPNVSKPLTNVASAEIAQFDAKVATEFGRLDGGAIGFATGIEFRREKIDIKPDPSNAAGQVLGLSTTAVVGSRDVKSAFFEFRTPFLKNFEMDFAGRFDKYPGLKTNFVPKVGAKWTVNDMLAVRSTYSKGFRAPAVSQVSPGGAQFFVNNLVDPVRCEEDGVTPKAGAAASDCAKSVSGVGTSNPDLKPENSKSVSFGLIFSPTRQFDVLLDWYNIRKEGEVALGSAQDVIDKPQNYPPTAVVRDNNPALLLNGVAGTGPLLAVSLPWTNQGSTEVSGIDFEFRGWMNVGDSARVSASLRGSYALSYRRAEQPGFDTFNVVGTNGGIADWATSVGDIPRMKLRAATSVKSGNHQLNGAMNYIGSVSYIRRYDSSFTPSQVYSGNTCHYGGTNFDGVFSRAVLGAAPTATNGRDLYINRYPNCKMGAWTTFDIGYTYTGIKNLTLGLSVQNFTDEKAPYAPNATISQGYNSALHSNVGRYFNLSVSYAFD